MTATLRLTGFRELEEALNDLGRTATQKAALRRSLINAARPMADLARSLAPVGTRGALAGSVTVGTKLSRRQQRMHRRMFMNDRAAVEVFVGPGPDPAAWNQEFGNINHGPQAFMRPAWDRDHMALLGRLAGEIRTQIDAAIRRAERRAARLAARGA